MKKKYIKSLSIFLIVLQLFLMIAPLQTNAIVNSQFNLGYTGSVGYTIMGLSYSNPSIETSFKSLADRAINIKNANKYSYSSAIQILTETKAVVNKITVNDYINYKERFDANVANNGTMSYQFTYESFIMRNVLYAMVKENASYTEIMKAVQIIYDTAVIQSKKDAFRSDALNVLVDVKILAGYTSNADVSNMLKYVSNFATGLSASYNGTHTLDSVNMATKYQNYLQEQYDKAHGDGSPIEYDKDNPTSEYAPGGYGDYPTVVIPPYSDTKPSDNEYSKPGVNSSNSFLNDLQDIYNGTASGQYILYYTIDKSAENPKYYKTKISTKDFITYENIVDALKTVARNTPVVYVEDSDAVLVVHNGVCSILDKSEELYDINTITLLFSNLKDFGFYIDVDKNTTTK